MVNKSEILEFFVCNICKRLLVDATAINECLHLFCKKCIQHKLTEEGLENCPVCAIHLGPKPLDKLRPDESMQSMRNTLFPPKERNVVNKAHDDDDVANADEKNKELLGGDSTGFSSKDPNNEVDATLKDLLKGSVENIKKESLSPDEKSDGMEKENVKGKNIISPNDVDGDDSDDENDDSDDDDSQGEKRSKQMRKKHKKKTRSIMEIYQKHDAIVPQESSNKSPSPLAVEDLNEVNMLKDNSSFWISLEASENQKGDMPLPQIAEKYIRIEDGSLPVSYLQDYLKNKLNLTSVDEVEITCLGNQVPSTMELERVANMSFKEKEKEKAKTKTSPNDYVAIIGYGRRRVLPSSS